MIDSEQPDKPLLSLALGLLGDDDPRARLIEELLATDFDAEDYVIRQLVDEV